MIFFPSPTYPNLKKIKNSLQSTTPILCSLFFCFPSFPFSISRSLCRRLVWRGGKEKFSISSIARSASSQPGQLNSGSPVIGTRGKGDRYAVVGLSPRDTDRRRYGHGDG